MVNELPYWLSGGSCVPFRAGRPECFWMRHPVGSPGLTRRSGPCRGFVVNNGLAAVHDWARKVHLVGSKKETATG